MKASAILFMVLLLSACGVARPVLESDNTKVEVKTVEKVVRDTAYIQLPVIIERVATLDTSSVLENKYAKSEARLRRSSAPQLADKVRQGTRGGPKPENRAGLHRVPGPGADRHQRGGGTPDRLAAGKAPCRRLLLLPCDIDIPLYHRYQIPQP